MIWLLAIGGLGLGAAITGAYLAAGFATEGPRWRAAPPLVVASAGSAALAWAMFMLGRGHF